MSAKTTEGILVRRLATNEIKVTEAVKILSENKNLPAFTAGESVVIAHGHHAGQRGKFKSVNGMYAEIETSGGLFKDVPVIFVRKSLQK
jgi:transcription antitermination factor NusG